MKLEQMVDSELETVLNGLADAARLLGNKRSFDKWVNRMQGRLGFSLARIVQGTV